MGDTTVELPDSIIKDPNQYYTVKHAIEDLEEIEPFTSMEADRPLSKPISKNKNPLLQYLSGSVEKVENHVMTETRQA